MKGGRNEWHLFFCPSSSKAIPSGKVSPDTKVVRDLFPVYLPIFETAYPDDTRPRDAIKAARSGAGVFISSCVANDAAHTAADDTHYAAAYAASAAAYAAAADAYTTGAAAYTAADPDYAVDASCNAARVAGHAAVGPNAEHVWQIEEACMMMGGEA